MDDEITDNKDDEEWKPVTTRMLNFVNNMIWSILVDYIMRIILNYGSFTFIIVPEPSPPSQTYFPHMGF